MSSSGTCSKCSKKVRISKSSSPAPVCRDCRAKVPKHGLSRYRNGCRCGVCKDANSVAVERSKSGTCTSCQKPMQIGLTSSSTPVCHDCRPKHGASGYRRGCRCKTCKAGTAEKVRKFTADYRKKTGTRYSAKYDRDGNWSSKWLPKSRRIALYERDGWTCRICDQQIDRALAGSNEPFAPCLDHIVPRSQGGDHSDDNLRTAHRQCNDIRGVRDEFDLWEVPNVHEISSP